MKIKHNQGFEVKFLGATNTKCSRIIIKDMRFNSKAILSFDYSIGNVITQAAGYLKSKGYEITAYSSNYNGDYFVMAAAIDNSFKNIKAA